MSIPIAKTLEEVRTDLFSKISSVQQEGWLPEWLNLNRGPIRGLIELWAWGLYQLYQFLISILYQAFPGLASEAWLDLHCKQVNIERLSETKASGTVYFMREETTGNVRIPKDSIVKTKPDGQGNVYRFITTEDVILPDGETEVAVAVEAEDYGRGSNVTAGQITEIATTIPGVDSVENRSGWLESEGADEEDDESLRERYVLAWMEVNGCTKYAYEAWSRSVAGVVAVKVMDQHPRGQGTVDVVLKGTAGIPTQDLIDAVDAVVQEKRPINDDVLVKAPGAVNVTIEAELELTHGIPGDILQEAENRLNALFLDPSPVPDVSPLQIGDDMAIDRLVSVIMAVDGVKKINWTSPTGDIQVDDDELAVLESIVLTYVWASEE